LRGRERNGWGERTLQGPHKPQERREIEREGMPTPLGILALNKAVRIRRDGLG